MYKVRNLLWPNQLYKKKGVSKAIMSTMLRPILRTSQRLNIATSSLKSNVYKPSYNFFSTQSSNDTERPTLSAKLFLEDGTVLTGKSFGCHTAVEGEVCYIQYMLTYQCKAIKKYILLTPCHFHFPTFVL